MSSEAEVQAEKWRNHDNGVSRRTACCYQCSPVSFIVPKPKDAALTGEVKSGVDAAVDDGNHQDFFTRDMVSSAAADLFL